MFYTRGDSVKLNPLLHDHKKQLKEAEKPVQV